MYLRSSKHNFPDSSQRRRHSQLTGRYTGHKLQRCIPVRTRSLRGREGDVWLLKGDALAKEHSK